MGHVTQPASILWITGLSGCGKSTLANAVRQEMRVQGVRPLLLDGDALRDALEGPDTSARHDAATRLARSWRIAKLARLAAMQGVPVIVATISLFHVIQRWNRDSLPPYAEVLLLADMKQLRARQPERYESTDSMSANEVVGLGIVPEYPDKPELRLHQDFSAATLSLHCAQVLALWKRLGWHESKGTG